MSAVETQGFAASGAGEGGLGYLGPFIGRDDELRFISDRIESGERLITVFGPPGIGKTRLAAEVLRSAEAAGLDVCFCNMGGARTEVEAAEALLAALDAESVACGDVARAAGNALRSRGPLVLALDNFDGLVSLAADIAVTWAHHNPQATFLVTSREVLRIPGEVACELQPLSLPATRDTIEASSAGRLLLAIAYCYRQDRKFDDTERQRLFDVLHRLEGVPLALEIVAPAIGLLGIKAVHERLHSVLMSPVHLPRGTALHRTGTLHAAVAESWELLNEEEKRALAFCSVFRGGFTLEALEVVVDAHMKSHTIDLLSTLRVKSLVRVLGAPQEGSSQFGLYAVVAEFAGEQLKALGLRDAAVARHRDYYAARARELTEYGNARASLELGMETENLAAALENQRWPDTPVAREQAFSLIGLLPAMTKLSPQRRLSLFDRVTADFPLGDDRLGSRLLMLRGDLLYLVLRYSDATDCQMRALEVARARGDGALEAQVLLRLGCRLALIASEAHRGVPFLEAAARIARAQEDAATESGSLSYLSLAYLNMGKVEVALRLASDAVGILASSRDAAGLGELACNVEINLGAVRLARSDLADADGNLRSALDRALRLGLSGCAGRATWYLGMVSHVAGELDDAVKRYRHALVQHEENGTRVEGAAVRATLALTLLERGRLPDALAVLAMAEAAFDGAENRVWMALVSAVSAVARARLYHTHVDLAPFVRAAGRAGSLIAQLAIFESSKSKRADSPEQGAIPAAPAVEGRLIESIVKRVLSAARRGDTAEDACGSANQHALLVHTDMHWFRPPGGAVVDCRSRNTLRALLLALAKKRVAAPGVALTVEELRAVGWPGERMTKESALGRLRQSMAVLRKLGLGDLLVWSNGGYILKPMVPVELCD